MTMPRLVWTVSNISSELYLHSTRAEDELISQYIERRWRKDRKEKISLDTNTMKKMQVKPFRRKHLKIKFGDFELLYETAKKLRRTTDVCASQEVTTKTDSPKISQVFKIEVLPRK